MTRDLGEGDDGGNGVNLPYEQRPPFSCLLRTNIVSAAGNLSRWPIYQNCCDIFVAQSLNRISGESIRKDCLFADPRGPDVGEPSIGPGQPRLSLRKLVCIIGIY